MHLMEPAAVLSCLDVMVRRCDCTAVPLPTRLVAAVPQPHHRRSCLSSFSYPLIATHEHELGLEWQSETDTLSVRDESSAETSARPNRQV